MKKVVVAAGLAAAVAVLATAAWGSTDGANKVASVANADTALVKCGKTRSIGLMAPFTGPAASIGRTIALSVAKDQGWTSFQVLGLLGFGLAMLVAFFIIEQRVKEPIVPFALFKNRAFAVSMVVGFFAALGMFGMIIFVPLELQGVLGASVTNSGLLLTPMMLGLIVASILSGQLIPRIKHYHYLGTIGIVLMMIGIYLLAQTTTSTAQMSITIDIVLVGLGLGVTMPLYINAVQSALPMRYLGVGTSQIQFWRNVGGTVSSAILGSILAQRLRNRQAPPSGHISQGPGYVGRQSERVARSGPDRRAKSGAAATTGAALRSGDARRPHGARAHAPRPVPDRGRALRDRADRLALHARCAITLAPTATTGRRGRRSRGRGRMSHG